MFEVPRARQFSIDCLERKLITLAEWKTVKEDDLEEEKEEGVDIEGEKIQEEFWWTSILTPFDLYMNPFSPCFNV